jgi:hypothetical protein
LKKEYVQKKLMIYYRKTKKKTGAGGRGTTKEKYFGSKIRNECYNEALSEII